MYLLFQQGGAVYTMGMVILERVTCLNNSALMMVREHKHALVALCDVPSPTHTRAV